ncbi:MAG TPA: hypothetical protein VH023_17220 [Rhodopila sp.]|jgi:hypothetical protein|nr:hypothetical protein [Rhodopila sp.]
MSRSPYDVVVLKERAELWRAEAAAATVDAMRIFCLTEADYCERRVQMSLSTPVIREVGQAVLRFRTLQGINPAQ